MVRTLDENIDKTKISEGILFVSLDANTDTFFAKVDKKSSVNGYFEVRGTSTEGRVIYDYRFDVSCLGAVDPFGSTPLPITSGGVSQDWVLAKLREARELQFSTDAATWHETRQIEDCYYRERYPEGEWTEAILIVNGLDGADGLSGLSAPHVQIQFANVLSGDYHVVPVSADYYIRFSSDNGLTWTQGALFHGKDGQDGDTGMTDEERARLLPSAAITGQVPVYRGNVSGWVAETFNYNMTDFVRTVDIGVKVPSLSGGKIPSGQIPVIPSSLMSTIPSSIISNLPIFKITDLQNQLNQKAVITNVYTKSEVDARLTLVSSSTGVSQETFNTEMNSVYSSITNLTNAVDSKLSKTIVYDMGTVSSQLTIDGKRGDYHQMEILSGSIVALGTNSFTNFSTGDSIVLEVTKPTNDSTFTYKGNIILGEAEIGTYLFGVINNGKGYLVTAPTEIL